MTSFKRLIVVLLVAVIVSAAVGTSISHAQSPLEITFYYPTAVGGPITKIMDGYAAEFNKANADIKVTPIYSGGYADVLKAIQTQTSGGQKSADVAILLSTDLFTLADSELVVPLDSFVKATKDGDAMLKDFYPAFMSNSVADGKLWGLPFQRSTPVLYYNKDLFKAAGLDPEVAPKNWADLVAAGKKLTKADGSQWGLLIPSDGFPYWLFQGFAIGNGKNLVGDDSAVVFFNTPTTIEALEFVASLSQKEGVMPKGVIKWGDAPTDFTAGKAAMIYHTTGSLTNILANAKFNVGVGFLPAGKVGFGTPTGGGNMYIMKSSPEKNQQASWRWMQFLASPEKQADWTVQTGYIAARQSAWDTKALKDLVAKYPQYAVARDQLKHADKELATHQGATIQQIFGKAVQAAVTGEKPAKQALDEAQAAADKLLADYKKK